MYERVQSSSRLHFFQHSSNNPNWGLLRKKGKTRRTKLFFFYSWIVCLSSEHFVSILMKKRQVQYEKIRHHKKLLAIWFFLCIIIPLYSKHNWSKENQHRFFGDQFSSLFVLVIYFIFCLFILISLSLFHVEAFSTKFSPQKMFFFFLSKLW